MAWKDWVNGENLDSADLNGNFDYIQRKLAEDTTAANTNTSSYVKIGDVSVGAGIVGNHILILVEMSANVITEASGYRIPYADIRIGETGSVVSKREQAISGYIAASEGYWTNTTLYYYYEPTTDEKANGFDIEIYGKYTQSGTGGGTVAHYNRMIVLGG